MLITGSVQCPLNVRVGPDGSREYMRLSRADARRYSFNRNSRTCQRCGACFEGTGIVNRSRADGQQFWPDPGHEKIYEGAPGEF